MKRKLTIAGMALAPLMFVAAVCGNETTRIETPPGEQARGISVTGEGKISAKPDLALVTLGVSALRPTVAEARDAAATSLNAMLEAIKNGGVEESDIQTSNLSIYPEYDYNGNTQTLRGFRVQNTVTAKVRDVDTTGEIVDAAVVAGGDDTTIESIAFTIDEPESLHTQAREEAVADAKRKAETLANASGVAVGEPISISEGSVFQPPIAYADRYAGAADSAESRVVPNTPIQPGELDVIINVTVTWSIQ